MLSGLRCFNEMHVYTSRTLSVSYGYSLGRLVCAPIRVIQLEIENDPGELGSIFFKNVIFCASAADDCIVHCMIFKLLCGILKRNRFFLLSL